MGRPPITREEANSTVGDKLEDACRRILQTDDQTLCDRCLQGIIDHAPEAVERYAQVEPECVHMLRTLSSKRPWPSAPMRRRVISPPCWRSSASGTLLLHLAPDPRL